jgi:hypothetical protein
VPHLSGAEEVLLLVLSVVWAFIGYTLSEQTKRTTGRTPWGLPSAVWAVLWFLSVIIGLVLYLIAQSSEARRMRRSGRFPGPTFPATPGPHVPVGMPARPPASDFPAYPRPARPAEPVGVPGPTAPPAPGMATGQATRPTDAPLPPPGWHPDPSGRFHYRWWDGTQWTAQVSVHGHVFVDTSPDQRIGPY